MKAYFLYLCTVLAALAVAGCYSEGTPAGHKIAASNPRRQPDAGPFFDASVAVESGSPHLPDAGPVCPPARSVETINARTAVMSLQASPTANTRLSVEQLFADFEASCGRCHVTSLQGDFHVDIGFKVLLYQAKIPASPVLTPDILQEMIDLIFSNDPAKVMPTDLPDHKPANERDPNTDPNLKLGAHLKLWLAQGQPAHSILLPVADAGSGANVGTFALTKAVGQALTNVGNCIPVKDIVASDPDDGRDAVFQAATTLPKDLKDTDLTTYDSEELARHGVIAYVPTYPLWSDDARKIRYVRVPRGQSIRFVKDGWHGTEFDIPDNTRFYKTFLRKVLEKDGSEHWRKIETRLIVARKATLNSDKSTYTQNALFGTYEWDKTETSATLVDYKESPVRSYDPTKFGDVLKPYVTDEGKLAALLATMPAGSTEDDILTADLLKGGAGRHYAIPGSERCVQCHEGGPDLSFVLGFTPLQIHQRPNGIGGVIEDPREDELSQFQRLIDYGVITGIGSPSAAPLLENSQPGRPPRNDYELKAQGYMLGNCAHCHNPNGYPSVLNPTTLANFLDFLPGPQTQEGIFQFPLDKVSPRIFRDVGATVKMPYITPSLNDYPGVGDFDHTAQHDQLKADVFTPAWAIPAPWRSLIYRNVDTPFPYGVDLALFPHMPMNVPGFDCRLPRIMGDWMVSIPARLPDPNADGVVTVQATVLDPTTGLYENGSLDTSVQPYIEVPPDDVRYDGAKAAAEKRLEEYHTGGTNKLKSGAPLSRYNYCPDTSDIVDPTLHADILHLVPSDVTIYTKGNVTYREPTLKPVGVPQSGGHYDEFGKLIPLDATMIWPDEGVPDRPHWVKVDSTEIQGDWTPRSTNWKAVLVNHNEADPLQQVIVDMLSPQDPNNPLKPSPTLPGVRLTPDFVDYATKPFAYGLWANKAACKTKLATMSHVSDYQGVNRPLWMDVASADPASPVYSELPGAAVYNMVCVNCHGPKADAHGRQADTLNLMTGGDARVADFRDGLFGPVSNPGDDIVKQFTIPGDPTAPPSAPPPASPQDWAARYMAWMALGGTTVLIPPAIINVVASTPVLGVPRRLPGLGSANMLTPIQTICETLFGYGYQPVGGITDADRFKLPGITPLAPNWLPMPTNGWDNFPWRMTTSAAYNGVLMPQNGDAELFARLCSMNNRPPVRMLKFLPTGAAVQYLSADDYPPNALVGTHRSTVEVGVSNSNLLPWCIAYAPDAIHALKTADGKPLPSCGQVDSQTQIPLDDKTPLGLVDTRRWSYRGAMNGGLAVFEYLTWLESGKNTAVPPYDQCETLP